MTRNETLLTLNHAARALGLAPNTLRAHADAGKIAYVRVSDGSRLFSADAVEAERERRYQHLREARRAVSIRVSWRRWNDLASEARGLARGDFTRDEARAALRRRFRAPRYEPLIEEMLRHFYDADEAAA